MYITIKAKHKAYTVLATQSIYVIIYSLYNKHQCMFYNVTGL